ncbi:MAG: hypothetical protein CMF48_03700 [Legionellales bacterium]|nr:hypothetical protein [Legionellales bacterium]|tara:strand:+ start:241 stop:858 length:618 start_codon:yes stop_codon:yes gene_type:complete
MNQSTQTLPPQRRNHKNVILVCLIAICLGPILFAWTIYQNSDHFQIQQKRAGELITPAVLASHLQFKTPSDMPVLAQNLQDKWWLVFTPPAVCDERCHQRLTELAQVNAALGKHVDEVGVIYLVEDGASLPEWLVTAFPNFQVLTLPQSQRLHYFLAYAMPYASQVGATFLLDPQVRVMMHYSHEVEARGILSDLKRLLRVAGGH